MKESFFCLKKKEIGRNQDILFVRALSLHAPSSCQQQRATNSLPYDAELIALTVSYPQVYGEKNLGNIRISKINITFKNKTDFVVTT